MATETIPEYLARMVRKHIDKGEGAFCGARDTREIAEFVGISVSAARKRLQKHEDAGEVECIGKTQCGAGGHALLWTIPSAPLKDAQHD